MVQNADAVVAHADFVGVREYERHAGEHLAMVLHHAVCLAAHVTGGGFNGGEGKRNLLEDGHTGKFRKNRFILSFFLPYILPVNFFFINFSI